MSDLPILFSAPMVQGLIREVERPGTGKTQTRRILKPQPEQGFDPWQAEGGEWFLAGMATQTPLPVRFAKGDRLWVKENWLPDPPRDSAAWDDWECSTVEFDGCGLKAAMVPPALRNADHALHAATWTGTELRWKPSIHMPRWASRLTLTVTDVRVQRLQEISEADCIAEGIDMVADSFGNGAAYRDYGLADHADTAEWYCRPIDSFRALWVKINGAASWVASPWVVAVTFTVERRNIDAGIGA